jgi:DNA-binding MarR family transcriptional regulator
MRFEETIGLSHLITGVENRMRAVIDGELRRLGMNLAQYSALSILEMKQPLTNAELARACGVTPQTMNRITSALTRSRMVTKMECEGHGLKVLYQLTPKALDRVCKAHAAVDKIEKSCLKGLNKEQQKALLAHLELVRKNLRTE